VRLANIDLQPTAAAAQRAETAADIWRSAARQIFRDGYTRSPRSTMDRTLARISILAAAGFLVIVLALLFLAPEVDPLLYGISFYALTGFGAVIGVAIALVGLSAICLGFGLWPSMMSVAGRIGAGLLITWGMFSLPASIFPLDPPGAAPTLSGAIHDIAGLSFLLAIPAVLLVEFSGNVSSRRREFGRVTCWLAYLIPISALLLFAFNGPFSFLRIGGLIQRLYWFVFTAWLVFKAWQLLPTRLPASA
jgi:hypothetical protein